MIVTDTPPRRPSLAFIVTEDWFFASHFLPMARAAVAAGLDVRVLTRLGEQGHAIAATGATVIAVDTERRSRNPFAIIREILAMAALLRRERPDLIHCIALKSILVGGLAGRLAGVGPRVYALTGLGFLGARRGIPGCVARTMVRMVLRGVLGGHGVRFLLENPDDARALGLDPADAARVSIVGGAGVDTDAYPAAPMPPAPPLKVAVVARMLWSKGIDLAVEATRLARALGADVELTLHGAPDPANPRSIDAATLSAWGALEGVTWAGPTTNVAAVWAAHHVCCLPSRGGEGLPRTLLEAAACGRAIATTDVPGCRHLVRDGIEGLVVASDDPQALAEALVRLADDPGRVIAMGRAARQRILAGYTERHVAQGVRALWLSMLARNHDAGDAGYETDGAA